ncbi:MAG: Zn-ribbon domain-containing OB-fold protein [Candidatus Helarchaeales archaeon]
MTDLPYIWREKKSIFNLTGYKCKKCEHINYPSRKVCVQCGSQELEEHQMSSTGTVLSFIVNHYLPKEFDKPLAIGVVELDGGGRLMTQFTEVKSEKDLKIGMRVEVVIRKMSDKDGMLYYGPKFKIIPEGSQ